MSSKVSEDFWNSLNQFKGIIEMNSLKNYLLTLVFFKYLTEESKSGRDLLFHIDVDSNFDSILKLTDNYFVGEQLNRYLHKIAISNDLLNGVINFVDFNQIGNLKDGKIQSEVLYNVINLINSSVEDLISENGSKSKVYVDLFDFIVLMFAESSGKSFIDTTTPVAINHIISRLLDIQENSYNVSVYDPTCGIGNTLVTVAENTNNQLHLFGQDMSNEMVAIATMNLLIHGLYPFEILSGDVLNSPKFIKSDNEVKKFDFVVSNPPFNLRSWNNNPEFDIFNRWNSVTGVPSNTSADFAFILHVFASLKEGGKAVIVVPHGVLFRGGSDANIRKYLIQNGYLTGIIGLPGKLYFGTGIPTCMIVLEKNKNIWSRGVFIMDASSEFIKDKFTNIITADGVDKIIDSWANKKQVSEFSRLVTVKEIVDNGYNLNIPRYLVNINESKIPENSTIVELSDLLTSLPKIRSNKDFGSTIKISDLSDNPFFFTISIDKLSVGEVNRSFYKITEPALLISKRFNRLKPSFCSASFDNPVFISQDIEAFIFNYDILDLTYLILQLNSDFVTKQAESLSIGSIMPSLSRKDIFQLKIILPNLPEKGSIILQRALAESAKIQSDKSKIETFQLQNTIDSLLKERMNDFQWKLHDIRNGELLSLKGQIVALEMYADANPNLFTSVIDDETETTVLSSIKSIYESAQKLAIILSDLYDVSDNVSIKEDINILDFITNFCANQMANNNNLFEIDYSDVEKIKRDYDITQLLINVNKNDLLSIFNNIFENAIRHGGFADSNLVNKIKIELSLDSKKEIISIAVLNNGKPSNISEIDYFADGGKAGITSNSGKGGHIVKVLTERNNGKVFQNNYTIDEATGYTFEVGVQFNYKLFYEL